MTIAAGSGSDFLIANHLATESFPGARKAGDGSVHSLLCAIFADAASRPADP